MTLGTLKKGLITPWADFAITPKKVESEGASQEDDGGMGTEAALLFQEAREGAHHRKTFYKYFSG
jgi:hypothetical protein